MDQEKTFEAGWSQRRIEAQQAVAKHVGFEPGKTYLIDVAWKKGNPVHHAIAYTDPHNDIPEWICLFNPSYEHSTPCRWDLTYFVYLKIIRELNVPFRFSREGDIELPEDLL